MAGKIFINYRRGESLKDAQHLATLLANRFGEKHIFLDVRGIDGGEHWLHTLEKQVAASEVMVALIGKGWIDVKDEEGNRRLDNPNDFVRFEIAQALQRDIPVLPVLLDGAQVPRIAQLPQDMMALSLFQAMPLRTESVVQDAEAIARRLKIMLDKRRPRGVPTWAVGVGATVVLTVGLAAGPFVLGQLGLLHRAASPPSDGQIGIILADLRGRLSAAEDAARKAEERVAAVTQDLKKLEQERNAISATLAVVQSDRNQARRDLASANTIIADLTKQRDTAGSEMVKARDEVERLKSVLATAQGERDKARSDLAEADAKGADLQKQLDAAKRVSGARKAEEQTRRDPALAVLPGSGQSFRDRLANGQPCPACPEMVVVPEGRYTMGSQFAESGQFFEEERPQVAVTIKRQFAVAKFAVTFDEWDACVDDAGCRNYRPSDMGWGRGKRPVINVSWPDAKAYIAWLTNKTGKPYRLLSEAEREYAARAGTTSPFWWGKSATTSQANFDAKQTVPANSFAPNPWGLYNVHGNVGEWTEDCWSKSHLGNPGDGSARTSDGDCGNRVIRGGAYTVSSILMRAAARLGSATADRHHDQGFRVARSIDP